MSAAIHAIPTGNLQDIPAALRMLADDIEGGTFGTVDALAWTLDGNAGYALGMIGGREPSDAHLLFTVAAAAMVQAVIDGKARL